MRALRAPQMDSRVRSVAGSLGYLIGDDEPADGALCLKCWHAR